MRFGEDIQGVIFDIDGVLLDSMEIWTDLGVRYILSKGGTPEKCLSDILFSMSMEEGAVYIRDHYLPDETEEEILLGLQHMLRDFYYDEVQAKAGSRELLEALKRAGVRITAATSSPRSHVERALERNGLLDLIERIFTNSEVGSSKHSPEIYHAATAYMGLKKREVCVVEDSLYALRTAGTAGYHTIGVYDGKGEPDQKGLQESAEIYIMDNQELMKFF